GDYELYPTKWLRNSAGTPIFLPQKLTLFLFGGPDLFTPKIYLVPFRGPRSLASSRYCASPEASIMRLKAASTKWLYALKTGLIQKNCHFSPCIQGVHHFFIKP
ncbi:MAG: hypothetical protein LHW42_02620, partial [Candidatus Cloacimonetes bacterium]|nr:hypothetical protein [Candidatus Cloacimonadota bacterium]